MRKPNAAQLRQMRKECQAYPAHLVEIPREAWPNENPRGCFRVLRNRRFLVQVYRDKGHIRLSVTRTEWDERVGRFRDDISWDHLQQLKREAGYGDQCAVEIYPPDEEIVNVANMRHIFLVPEPDFMWRRGQ